MVLSLGIILILLGILVFALRGFFGVFPDNWEWVGIVLAGVGLLMGVPSTLQMMMGRPKLILDFDRIEKGEGRTLAIFLKNPQLGNPQSGKKSIWRKLGFKRETIESLTASFCIVEIGTRKVMTQPIMHARIYSDDDPTDVGNNRIALPPTLSFETCVMIAMWNDAKKKAIVPGDRNRPSVELSASIYQIEAIFIVDGEPQKEFRRFVVGNTADDLIWVKPTPRKKGSQT